MSISRPIHLFFALLIAAIIVLQSNTPKQPFTVTAATATLSPLPNRDAITASNAAHLKMLLALTDPHEWVLDVAFSNDGKLLAASTIRGDVYLWQASTGLLLAVLSPTAHELPSSGLRFSPDNSLLASSAGSNVILWNVKSMPQNAAAVKFTLQGQKSFVRNLDFSPDGRFLASRSDDGTVQLWDVATGTPTVEFQGDDGQLGTVLFDSTGEFLISASDESDTGSTVQVWSVKTKTRKFSLPGHAPVALSPNGSRLSVISGGDNPSQLIYDLDKQRLAMALKTKQGGLTEISASVFSADGTVLIDGTTWHEMILWNVETGTEIERLGGGGVDALALSPDGKLLAIGYAGSGFSLFVELWGIEKD